MNCEQLTVGFHFHITHEDIIVKYTLSFIIFSQTVMFIYNEYTREQNVYNPLREKRPMGVPPRPETE